MLKPRGLVSAALYCLVLLGAPRLSHGAAAFALVEASIHCPNRCSETPGQIAVNTGVPGLALCSVTYQGGTFYGTWVKGACRYYIPALGGQARYSGISCSCYNPVASILTWNNTAACAAGEAAGAEGPAVCRITKAGGGDFRFGWWANNKCYTYAESFGPQGEWIYSVAGLGGVYDVRLLCKKAGFPGRRRLAAPLGFQNVPMKPDCGWSCVNKGATWSAVSAGPLAGGGQALLCALQRDNYFYYGTFAKGDCAVNAWAYGQVPGTETVAEDYKCGCTTAATSLAWRESTTCASDPVAAATLPAVCRISRSGGADSRVGWFGTQSPSCYVPQTPWGAGGSFISNITGVAGRYSMQLLCKPAPDYRKCVSVVADNRFGLVKVAQSLVGSPIAYTAASPARWSGIAGGVCPPGAPPSADQASLITWIYWTAFGKGPDHLNGLGWADSSIASLRTKGLVRAKAGWTNVPPYLLVTPITSAAAKPGDVVFYGKFQSYVALYLGADLVLHFAPGPTGQPQVKPFSWRGDADEIRAYTDFLIG